ncbi:MAG: type II secretion system protein [Limisphaerales bacterium]
MDKVRPKDCAFTLMELLVVMAISAILAALLLPVLSRAKTRAVGIQCLGNLKQLQLAWQMYVNDHNDFIPGNHWWKMPDGWRMFGHGKKFMCMVCVAMV